MPKKDKIFENRASLDERTAKENECLECGEPLIFAMRDKTHEFSMGLFTVLECLKFAEREGAVPKLPDDWWLQLEGLHSKNTCQSS